jgi:hypothetical protein
MQIPFFAPRDSHRDNVSGQSNVGLFTEFSTNLLDWSFFQSNLSSA